ncbi:MAG: hypothetical protein P0Y65_10335 [Candidatus Devosia phytovorans]|uniref:Uncharacterized protein n=1 Tax=Candidatus Devosia phytovorans TaxID=3121372 RepID=A0AAJ5VX90_9HYPH|nr:hypothetical protein [Devosia sp.]WEK06613.1 MAG: hypothetical protein P0Y65_10335 [Devosia sp.]
MAIGIAAIGVTPPEYPVSRVSADRISDQDLRQDRAEQRGEVNVRQAAIQAQREVAPATTERQTVQNEPAPVEARPQPLDFSDQPRAQAIETEAALRAYEETQAELDESEEASLSASELLQSRQAVQSYDFAPSTPTYVVDFSR